MKHPLSFIELHNPIFMQNTNLGNKVNASVRKAKLQLDTELGVVWIQFNGKTSFVPLANIASGDMIHPEAAGLEVAQPEEAPVPPAIARARRGRPPLNPSLEPMTSPTPQVPYPDFDPNDAEAVARHRQLVRAASANSNKPAFVAQNDHLIQEARNQALGFKAKAQVSNPTMPKEGASVSVKSKAISHAQLREQAAQDPNT